MLPGGRGVDLIIVAAIALIVVGPKDLPKLLRKVGQFVGRMRAMADEFRASFDEMARQSELDDLRREVEALRTGQSRSLAPIQDLSHQMKSLDTEISGALSTPVAPVVAERQPAAPLTPVDTQAPPPKKARARKTEVAPDAPAPKPATKARRRPKTDVVP